MKYTKLGRSNLIVSKICLGTMHFGPYASEEESFRIMDRALWCCPRLTGQSARLRELE